MAKVRVRQDIWDLGDESNPWRDPVIVAYAQGVGAMQALAESDPAHPANWINQAAIHEHLGRTARGRLEDQCQHACWFFLPWHRMYLYRFEQIVRSQLTASVGGDWALPYWNYSDDPARRVLPPAFRQRTLRDGTTANPLFTAKRQGVPIDINGGQPMLAAAVSLTNAMAPGVFSRSVFGASPGFGGGQTNPLFHHSASGPFGPLEGTPHGAVHNQVGGANGLMTRFNTAALDPIFWLHHANIDRLWEQWRRQPPNGSNPSDVAWLAMGFELVDENGTRVSLQVSEVLEIEAQLSYTYSGLPAAAPPAPPEREEVRLMPDDVPAEMVGAIDEPIVLEGAAAASTSFPVSAPSGPRREEIVTAGRPAAIYLNVEDIEGEANPGLLYGVYVNLPDGEPPDPESPHFVGVLSFFGIESTVPDVTDEEAPHRLRYVFDITDTVAELTARGRWNPDHLQVTFAPIGIGPDTQLEHAPPPVRIGRVSLFVE
jgi:tyrosinase